MMTKSEETARQTINEALGLAGWAVQDAEQSTRFRQRRDGKHRPAEGTTFPLFGTESAQSFPA